MTEALTTRGWVKYYDCLVCNTLVQFFNHPDKNGYEVKVKPKKNTFSLIIDNRIIAGPFWGYQLEEKMNQYGF